MEVLQKGWIFIFDGGPAEMCDFFIFDGCPANMFYFLFLMEVLQKCVIFIFDVGPPKMCAPIFEAGKVLPSSNPVTCPCRGGP